MVVISGFIYTSIIPQENKLKAQEITISDIVIKEDYEALEVDITIPVIQGLADKQVEDEINQISLFETYLRVKQNNDPSNF